MRRRGRGTRAGALATAAGLLLGGCISGPVLHGYPGYPLLAFTVAAPPDSVFFSLKAFLVEAGFPLDYTRREEGLINTRRSLDLEKPVFLSVVFAEEPRAAAGGGESDPPMSRVWIAGYLETDAGPRRINPDAGPLWDQLRDVSAALSRRLGGTPPTGPDD